MRIGEITGEIVEKKIISKKDWK